ncbi:MAG TPA: DUF3592 domain-containing protein [Terriglobales bacterium]|nr:DUF3592 domain-containing protein [Terriglobales bacterium]
MKHSAQPAAISAIAASNRPPRPGQTLKVVAAALFLAFVLPLLLLAGLLAWHQYRILTTWPAVDAVVTSADWTTYDSAPGRRPVYGARLSFRYPAAGRAYEASAELTAAARSEVERWMKQMPVGSHQRIRYDPGHPATITLAADYTSRSFAAPRALAKWAVIIAAASTGLFGLGWRAGKQRPGAGSQQSAKPA